MSVESRGARRPKVTRKPSRLVLLLIKDQPPWRRLTMTSIQRCLQVSLLPHPTLSPFQRQRLLTSVGGGEGERERERELGLLLWHSPRY